MVLHRFRLADNHAHKFALAAILLIAFAMRVNGIGFGLPYQLHPDEPHLVITAAWLSQPGGMERLVQNPTLYQIAKWYPPLYSRFLVLQRKCLQTILGANAPQYFFFLLARSLNVFLSLACILLISSIASSLDGPVTGSLAAIFLTVNPTFVKYSRYAVADMPMTFLALLAIYLSLISLESGQERTGYTGLLFSLLAFTTKYNALPVMVVPLYAILRNSFQDRRRLAVNLLLLCVILPGAFLLLQNRYNLLTTFSTSGDPQAASILEKGSVFAVVSAQQNFGDLITALTGNRLTGATSAVVIVIGFLIILRSGSARGAVDWERVGLILSFIIMFPVGMSFFTYYGIRQLLVVLALAAAIWALTVRHTASFLTSFTKPAIGQEVIVICGVAMLLLTTATVQTVSYGFHISQKDTRAITADWFEENVPNGAKIVAEYDAVEFMADYGGYPGTKRFSIDVVHSLLKSPVDEYRREGVRYLIADSRSEELGGYFSDPDNEEFVNNVTVVKMISNEGRPGPARIIFHPWPSIQHPMPVNLGDQVTFLGYNIDKRTVRAGDILHLILYWQAQRPMDASYTVFTHLVDQEGLIWGQKDHLPLNGVLPTNSWPENEVIADDYPIVVKEDTPPGEYQLFVGMYLLETMERLPVLDKDAHRADNAIVLTHVQVIP